MKKPGTRSPILCGDLVKAVRRESEVAVAHHFGVSKQLVRIWRRLLDVPAQTEGSRDLHRRTADSRTDDRLTRARAASKAPAAVAKMSAYWRERRGHPPGHPGSRFWTVEEDALLGTATDAEVGRRIGRSWRAVAGRRAKLGVARYHSRGERGGRPYRQSPERTKAADAAGGHRLKRLGVRHLTPEAGSTRRLMATKRNHASPIDGGPRRSSGSRASGWGVTRRKLAERIGQSQWWVGRSETGGRRLDVAESVEFSAGCGIDPASAPIGLARQRRRQPHPGRRRVTPGPTVMRLGALSPSE